MTNEKKDAINKCVTIAYSTKDTVPDYYITYHTDGSLTLDLPKGLEDDYCEWGVMPDRIALQIKKLQEEGYYDPDGYYPIGEMNDKRNCEVTTWKRFNADSETWEHNHIESGHIGTMDDQDLKPVGDEVQTKNWAQGAWRHEHKSLATLYSKTTIVPCGTLTGE